MDLDHTTQVVEQLALNNIPSLVVGELALNYYNVPRVVHVSPEQSPFVGNYLCIYAKVPRKSSFASTRVNFPQQWNFFNRSVAC
jgi:hypothetical protein